MSSKPTARRVAEQDADDVEEPLCAERAFINAVARQIALTGAELDAKASVVASFVGAAGQVDRELLGAVQSFDRLEQELAAMAELLLRYADLAKDRRTVKAIDSLVLSSVRLSSLKARIAQAWRGETPAPAHDSEDELF